jgi:mevalonate kinase
LKHTFYSNGKLLLTGEYLVLDGARSLALPCALGQYLTIEENETNTVQWESYDSDQSCWFTGYFQIGDSITTGQKDPVSGTLATLLNTARILNPAFLQKGCTVKTRLTFSKDFGLGSSSTLIANLAAWAKIDPYTLLWNGFTGSGYDIACAGADQAITYQLTNSKTPEVHHVDFDPVFKDSLFFVYLNKKQNSREGIANYKALGKKNNLAIATVNTITKNMIQCASLSDFEQLINMHESCISKLIQQPRVSTALFPDYFGQLKSLGAWGGDFILATGNEETPRYFKEKGYATLYPYDSLIKKH